MFDTAGAPAPGVALLLAPATPGQNAPIKSDANGKYTLNWQPRPAAGGRAGAIVYLLVARDLEHNAAASHAVDATTTSLDLHLQPGLTISTQVRDVDGKPISGASANLIVFLDANGIGSSITRPPVRADRAGRIQIAALPRGYACNLAVGAQGYGMGQPATIQESDTQTNFLELPAIVLNLANLKLAGQVLDANGQPMAGARITIAGQGQPSTNTQTDATGHFALDVCKGAVSVTASLQGAAGRVETGSGDTNVIIRLGNIANKAAATPPRAIGPANQRLEGQVVGLDGTAVPGVRVRSGGPGQPTDLTLTDGNGRFRLNVAEGAVRVFASVPANEVNSQLGSATVQAQAGDMNVVVRLGGNPVLPKAPLKEQDWTWAALVHWPEDHKEAVMVLLSLQLTVMLGAAGSIWWLTRRRAG